FKRVVHLTSINVKSNTYCTSFIEITSPTQTKLMTYDSEGIRTFYNKFFNAMAQIIAQNNGKILKNIGDGIASYFPKTSDYTDDSAIKDVLECCLIQIERQQSLSIDMAREKLPEISYKICTDYGVLNYEINLDDVFDKPPWLPPVYKICSTVSTNTAVLGDDLYKIITALPLIQEKYLIERIGEYIDDARKNVPYSFYSLSRCPN
ncbi:MAG: hypothetical protein WA393_13490, partial [Nitrososphaeraceae archaeon]